jgi:glycosyltransferase involved in cell wall biosynthesis
MTNIHPVSGTFFRDQVLALRKNGVQTGVIYSEFRTVETCLKGRLWENHFHTTTFVESNGATLISHHWGIPFLKKLKMKLWIAEIIRLYSLYSRTYGKPDIIHAHSAFYAGMAAVKIKQRFGVPYVVTEHATFFKRGIITPWQLPGVKLALTQADAVITVSRGLAEDVQVFIPGKYIEIIPNLVDCIYFHPPVKRKYKPFAFLSVGFLTQKKGFDRLIRAFAIAFEKMPDVHLNIAGEGTERHALQRLVNDLGMGRQIFFLGELSREQVRNQMWQANQFVLASHVETFGVVLLEAMATGLPVIATRCGGPEDFVTAEVGYLTDWQSDAQFAAVLEQAYRQYQSQHKEQAIREYVVSRYSDTVVAQKIIHCYQQVLGSE